MCPFCHQPPALLNPGSAPGSSNFSSSCCSSRCRSRRCSSCSPPRRHRSSISRILPRISVPTS